MGKIRVLVVDDSVVFRKILTDVINEDPLLEVAGAAANGRIALAKLTQINPDLVILDVEMPELDGLSTLKEIRRTHPKLPVVMFSALTERGALATLEALSLGASDYFAKPASAAGTEVTLAVVRDQLIPKVKALAATQSKAPSLATFRSAPTAMPTSERVDIVAIGCSTGGPNALAEIFAKLPASLPVPIVIVQHMPPMFTRLLAERLTAQFAIPVAEGAPGTVLTPGQAWIAPGDHHMIVARDGLRTRLMLHQDPPENSCRPAVDVLLRSVAVAYGANSLSVILTGMGQDGLRGCERLRSLGAQILAQDEASSVVWGMPGFVARAGLADRILPLNQIADEITSRVRAERRIR
ncbi:MAG: chemotaxis response regulator protein-glutamate methylesterase [Gemmataceae bacterium]